MFVIVLVRANPFPEKDVAGEFADGAVMVSNPHRPVGFTNRFEVERRMKSIDRPELKVLSSQNFDFAG